MDLREEGLLPAGVVERIDRQEEKVYVSVTKDQIKDSPRFVSEALDRATPAPVAARPGQGGPGRRAASHNKLWAYPWMIAFLIVFIGYQLYRIVLHPRSA